MSGIIFAVGLICVYLLCVYFLRHGLGFDRGLWHSSVDSHLDQSMGIRGASRNPKFWNSDIVRIPIQYSDGQHPVLSDNFGQSQSHSIFFSEKKLGNQCWLPFENKTLMSRLWHNWQSLGSKNTIGITIGYDPVASSLLPSWIRSVHTSVCL